MISISVPIKHSEDADRGDFFSFPLSDKPVLFTGTHHRNFSKMGCDLLIQYFAMLDCSFVVGCNAGIDRSFRLALSHSEYADKTLVACINRSKFRFTYGLRAKVIAPVRFMPESIIFHRSMWLAKNSSCGIIFTDNHYIGKWDVGMRKLFLAYLSHLKPMFLVTDYPPEPNGFYHVLPTSLNGVVNGYWIAPVCIGKELSFAQVDQSYPHKLLEENPLCRE